ncbi:MAG: hypothetical protein JXR35_13720 [Rhodobacteraceae bacterium]|nr:hypothetical protein [Paracoccaceae bacterium]
MMHPFTFLPGAMFECIDLKTGAMSLGAVFVALDLIAVSIWTGLGQALSRRHGAAAKSV